MGSGRKLSQQEIEHRLQEGRNYKHLYTELKLRFDDLSHDHKQCPKLLADLQAILATQSIRIAELEAMVFGKKKRPPSGRLAPLLSPLVIEHRDADSYRRPTPPPAAITETVSVPLPKHCACGGSFDQASVTTHDRYQEDIPLPELTADYQPHLVTKFAVQRAVCNGCGHATAEQQLGGQPVTLGTNVRLLVTHLVAVVGMSYNQVTHLLRVLYNLTVSGGEVATILHKQHEAWLPAYNQLKDDIRAAPVDHVDETPWPIQDLQGQGYAWCLSDAGSTDVCFSLADSRGVGHAKNLFGNHFSGVRVSDDYCAYRNLPGQQQLCWVHLYRTIRDLVYNEELPKLQRPYLSRWYAGFAGIYQDLRQYLAEPYDKATRKNQAVALWRQVQVLASQPSPKSGEPRKLTRLKAQLLRAGKDRLFVCLPKNTPCDNNRAERDLRQLVLKRKRSFGSKTRRGAQALATVLSICTTTWRRNPTGYFGALAAVG